MSTTLAEKGSLPLPGGVGGLLAVLTLPIHAMLPTTGSVDLAAGLLFLMAGVYVGFALQDGRIRIITVESVVATLFAITALVGLSWSPWVIPAGIALHGVWDFAHHRHISTAMPRWYIPFCALYDWVYSLGLALLWWGGA